MKLTRIWPAMAEQDKNLRTLYAAISERISVGCGGDAEPEITHSVADPGFWEMVKSWSQHNVRKHREAGYRDHEDSVMLMDPGLHLCWQLYRWRATGGTIYDLDAGLASAFMDTELRVSGDDVEVPVPTFYLSVPPELGLRQWSSAYGWHALDGFFVSRARMLEDGVLDGDEIKVTEVCSFGGKMTRATFSYDKEFRRMVSVLAIGMPRPGMRLQDIALNSFPLPMSISDYESYIERQHDHPRFKIGMTKNMDEFRVWHRLIVNTMLYLATPGATGIQQQRLGPSQEQKRAARAGGKAAKRELDAATLPVRYLCVGAGFIVDRGVRERGAADAETRELTKRFMVRGHWRMQPHGPGRKQRKPMWIKPHWRGPDWAEVARAHVAKIVDNREASGAQVAHDDASNRS